MSDEIPIIVPAESFAEPVFIPEIPPLLPAQVVEEPIIIPEIPPILPAQVVEQPIIIPEIPLIQQPAREMPQCSFCRENGHTQTSCEVRI